MSGIMVPVVAGVGSTLLGAHMPMALSAVNTAGNLVYNTMELGQAFVSAYNLGILPAGGEATDVDQRRQYAARLAAGLKPHFSTMLTTIAASDNAVALFNGQGLVKVNFPDLVTAGLATAESARSLEEAVTKQAQTMVDSAVSVFRNASSWWSLSRVIPRAAAYVFAVFFLQRIMELTGYRGDPSIAGAIIITGALTYLIELCGSAASRGMCGPREKGYDSAHTALLGLRAAFPTVFAGEKKATGTGGPA